MTINNPLHLRETGKLTTNHSSAPDHVPATKITKTLRPDFPQNWNADRIVRDVAATLNRAGFPVKESIWQNMLEMTIDETRWELNVEVARQGEAVVLGFTAVSDHWAEDDERVRKVDCQLNLAARTYMARRGIPVRVGPVPRW